MPNINMATRRPPRGGSTGNWNRNSSQAPVGGTGRFPKEPGMRTFVAIEAQERREKQKAEEDHWLGQPPADVNLLEVLVDRIDPRI